MALESAEFISELNSANPVGPSDFVAAGDDHLRMVKQVLLNSFPGVDEAVDATAEELNVLDGADTTGQASGLLAATSQKAARGKIGVLNAECRLDLSSATSLSLGRYNGRFIPMYIAGAWTNVEIPTSGVALSNGGLSANTFYYIYAYDASGTLTLQASTTVPSVDVNVGLKYKADDLTRLLVGCCYTNASAQFEDSSTRRTVLSWYNRLPKDGQVNFTPTGAIATGQTNLSISALAMIFCHWGVQPTLIRLRAELSWLKNASADVSEYVQGGPALDGALLSSGIAHLDSATGLYYNQTVASGLGGCSTGAHTAGVLVTTTGCDLQPTLVGSGYSRLILEGLLG